MKKFVLWTLAAVMMVAVSLAPFFQLHSAPTPNDVQAQCGILLGVRQDVMEAFTLAMAEENDHLDMLKLAQVARDIDFATGLIHEAQDVSGWYVYGPPNWSSQDGRVSAVDLSGNSPPNWLLQYTYHETVDLDMSHCLYAVLPLAGTTFNQCMATITECLEDNGDPQVP